MTDMATVVAVTGKAFARSADGELRELQVGDVLREGETVVTADGSRVELSMTDTSPLVISDAGEFLITRDLVAESAAGADESALADETVDQVLAALENGQDLGDVLESTATGSSGGAGGEGSSFIRLGRIVEQTTEFRGLVGSEGEESTVEEDDFINPVEAVDDVAETPEGEPVTIDVEANDQFLEGSYISAVTQPANGTVVVNSRIQRRGQLHLYRNIA